MADRGLARERSVIAILGRGASGVGDGAIEGEGGDGTAPVGTAPGHGTFVMPRSMSRIRTVRDRQLSDR